MAKNYQWKKIRDKELEDAKRLEEITAKLTKNYTDITTRALSLARAFKEVEGKVNIQSSKERMNLANIESNDQKLASIQNFKILFENQSFQHTQDAFNQKVRSDKAELDQKQQHATSERKARDKERSDEIDHRKKVTIEKEKVHGENVRYNLRMRALYRDQGQSFSNVMNMMTGSKMGGSFRGAAMGGVGQIFGAVSKGSGILADTKLLKDAQEEYNIFKATSKYGDPKYADEDRKLSERVDRLTEILKQTRDRMGIFQGIMGGEGAEGSAISKRLEPLVEWAKKHKTGIILSAASIGLMFITFKKLLSVSPMLQKMLEIMGLAFNLVLRPFGDFIGFILRPIAMMMLTSVMPFFKAAYPFLMTLGSAMGEKFAKGDILGGLGLMFEAITPMDVLAWIFGDREDNIEGAIGAGGAVIGGSAIATGVIGSVAAIKTGQYMFNKITGNSGNSKIGGTYNQAVNQGKKGGNIFSGAGQKILSALGKGVGAKGAVMAAARAMTAFKLSNPIGWALLGWEGVTSAIKHFSPETYQQMRDSTEFMGVGREFIGLGENSLAEHGVAANNWLQHQLYGEDIGMGQVPTPEDGLGVNPNYNPQYREPSIWDTNQRKLPIQITFNIDKVEKGVDVNMIALQVKAILETSNTRIG